MANGSKTEPDIALLYFRMLPPCLEERCLQHPQELSLDPHKLQRQHGFIHVGALR